MTNRLSFRAATSADVPAIAACRVTDPAVHPVDPRMTAYFDGEHFPREALRPRVGYLALDGEVVIGYIAGHLTARDGYQGEVQYLFVAPPFRRHGVASSLLRRLATWFLNEGVTRVCVCIDADSPSARPFYARSGATSFKRLWFGWEDIATVIR